MASLKGAINKFQKIRYQILEANLFDKIDTSLINDIGKKRVFIYFDYEREFSGHKTQVTDEKIIDIVDVLAANQLTSTWFTVGRVIETYPESIDLILSQGNELSSHTYSHIDLRKTRKGCISRDFDEFDRTTPPNYNVRGFHPPRDNWSLQGIKCCMNRKFDYDVVKSRNTNNGCAYRIQIKGLGCLIRLISVIDDWDVYKSAGSQVSIFCEYVKILDSVYGGGVIGMGFHPWIITSEPQIFESFCALIEHLGKRQDVIVNSCGQLADALKNNLR
jgi:hypothetical protein